MTEVARTPDVMAKRWLAVIPVALTAITLVALWLLAVPTGPEVCALIDPAPRNCYLGARVQAATVATVLVVLIGAATTVAGSLNSRYRRMLLAVGVGSLVVAAVVSWTSVAWIPGLAS